MNRILMALSSALVLMACVPEPRQTPVGETGDEQLVAEQGPRRILLEYGWDRPLPAEMTDDKLEASPFDGVVFQSGAGDRVLVPRVLDPAAFDADIARLKALTSKKRQNSLYRLLVNTEPTWDWYDDAMWQSALQNIRQLGRVSKAAGLRGLMFDPEPYSFNLWNYAAQARRGQHSFAQYEQKLFQRGQEAMRALEAEHQGLEVLALYGFDAFELPQDGQEYAALHAALERDSIMGLYAAFLEGMLDAASPQARLISGNEGSYYYLGAADFDLGRGQHFERRVRYVRPELRAKYARQMGFSSSLYADGLLNLWESARFPGYYLPSAQSRLDLVAHNVYHGLRTTDRYVWVYSENMDWWKGTVPPGLDAALRRARAEQAQGKPLSRDPSSTLPQLRATYLARVDVGGDFQGKKAEGVSFGTLQKHCATWNDSTRWSCTQPPGSSFTVRPTLEGVSFDPPEKTYTNLTQSKWGEVFVGR